MRKSLSNTRSRIIRAGFASGVVTVAVIAGTGVPAFAAVPMVLSATAGPSGGGNSLTGTAAATATVPTPFPAGVTPVVQFQYLGTGTAATCSALYKAPVQITAGSTTPFATTAGVVNVDPSTVKRVSATKIAFTVPSASSPAFTDPPANTTPSTINTTGLALVGSQTTARYNVCVYDSASTTTSTLLATSSYTIATRPKITAINPLSSPALGGTTVTVNGSGFSVTGTTATLGGVAMTNIKVAANGNSFTATAPAHSAGENLPLIVTTAGGIVTSTDPDNNGQADDGDATTLLDNPIVFEYSNGVSIAPNTAPANTSVDVSVQGVGFQQLRFDNTVLADDTATEEVAGVFLVDGAYNKATNRGIKQCTGVLVISDSELICTLDFTTDALDPTDSTVTSDPVEEGAYTLTVVADGSTAATDAEVAASNINSGATFTVAPY